jgi:hypothetical protein
MKSIERFGIFSIVAAFLLTNAASVSLRAQSYGDEVGKSIIRTVVDKSDQKYWKSVAYPTDNFGVGTLYDGQGAGSFLCATSTCLNLSDNKTETLKKAGYIDQGKGSAVKLNDTQKSSLGVNAVLKLFTFLNISPKFDRSKTEVFTVDIPGATVRYLIKGQLSKHIENAPPNAAVKDAFDHKRLRAIVGDIIVDSMTVSVKFNGSMDASAKATLDQGVGKIVGKDSDFSLTYSKSADGTYTLKTVSPVIVAVEPVKQKSTSSLESNSDPWVHDPAFKLKTDN